MPSSSILGKYRKNEILDDVLRVATDDITERLYDLLQGERVVARIDQNVVYRSLAEDPANIYSLLLVAGYLKLLKGTASRWFIFM